VPDQLPPRAGGAGHRARGPDRNGPSGGGGGGAGDDRIPGANGSLRGAGRTAGGAVGADAGRMPPNGGPGGWSNGGGRPRGRPRVRRPALRALVRSLLFMRHYKAATLASLVCLLASSAGNLAVPRITQLVVDSGILDDRLQAIVIGSLMIFAVTVLRSLFTYLQGVLAAKVSQGVAYDLRNSLYDHIQSLSFSYHDRSQTGQLLTRATSDVDMVRTFISTGVIQIVTTAILIVGSLYLLFITNWRLALHVVPVMLAVFVLFSFMARKGRPIFRGIQEKIAALNTRLEENLVGVRVVKAYTGAVREQRRFDGSSQELYDQSMRAAGVFSLAIPLVFAMSNFGTLVVTWGGGIQILAQRLSIGELVAFQGYLIVAMFPITMLGMIMMSISQASASAERIFEILDAESAVQEHPDATPIGEGRGEVRFEGVSFEYGGTERVLHNLEIHAKPGDTVALLGPTGSGKSTVVNLLPRFYDATTGRITIDGEDVRDVTLESLRNAIGIVQQDLFLFIGTIRENIAYGLPDATDEQIEAAARAAKIHDFIMEMPEGYNTWVGERGTTLSGGQRQRISIARTLLRDPRVLILDDSTASVDMRTEYEIHEALQALMENRTTFVIAQRLRTVKAADQIIVLRDGEIVEHGHHEELLAEDGFYRQIYDLELRDQEEASASLALIDGGGGG